MALDLNAEFVLTDDLKAMNACKILGLKFVNAISLLFSLYEENKIPREIALGCLDRLEEFGWYDVKIIKEFRKLFRR